MTGVEVAAEAARAVEVVVVVIEDAADPATLIDTNKPKLNTREQIERRNRRYVPGFAVFSSLV
jgi:hypothetical protein